MEHFFDARPLKFSPDFIDYLDEGWITDKRNSLERIYNTADDLFNRRFRTTEDSDSQNKNQAEDDEGIKFDKLIELITQKPKLGSIDSAHETELNKLKLLTLGNLWLRKGQYLDETFRDSRECYLNAAAFLWQVYDDQEYTLDNLLICMNLGKYFRNKGKLGRRSNYISAEKEFNNIIRRIEAQGENSNKGTLDTWEYHLWLEARINIGRIQKSQYNLKEAKDDLWEIVRYLLLKLKETCVDIDKNDISYSDILNQMRANPSFAEELDKVSNVPIYDKMPPARENSIEYKIYKDYLLQAMVQLGIIYRKCLLYSQVEELCDIIIQIDKDNIDAQNERGVCQRKQGLYDQAKETFEPLKEQGNRFATINYWKCKLKLGDLEINEIEKKLVANSNDFEVLHIKGGYYQKLCDWEKAQEIYGDIYKKMPYLRQGTMGLKSYYNIAKCLLAQRDYYQAKEILSEITKRCKEDIPARIDLGWCYMKLGYYASALDIYETLVVELEKEAPDIEIVKPIFSRMRIYNNCGECYLRLGQIPKAIKEYNKVLKEEPKNAEANYFLAQCLIYYHKGVIKKNESIREDEVNKIQEDYKKAITLIRKAVEYKPRESRFISGLAIARMNYLQLDPPDAEDVKKQIEQSLRYIQGPYSLKACTEFATYINNEAPNKKDSNEKEINELYESFARVDLGEQEEGYGAFRHFQDEPAFQQLKPHIRGQVLVVLYKMYKHIVGIKNICRDTRVNQSIVHYTKMGTLKKLLTRDKEKMPRMRLWNSVYMNDPFEGEIFIDLIKRAGNFQDNNEILKKYFLHLTNRDHIKESNYPDLTPVNSSVYFTSFSAQEDNIQMWVQYADSAKGCNLEFDDSFFDTRGDSADLDDVSIYMDQDYPLYKVQYIEMKDEKNEANEKDVAKDGNQFENIRTHIQKIEKCLHDMENIEKEILESLESGGMEKPNEDVEKIDRVCDDVLVVIRSFIANRLNEVRFLFKDKEYEHEKEYRLVQYSHNPIIDEENFAVPRLYIEVNKDIILKQVMLGTKVSPEDVNEIVSWLYTTEKVKKVTQSVRHYK